MPFRHSPTLVRLAYVQQQTDAMLMQSEWDMELLGRFKKQTVRRMQVSDTLKEPAISLGGWDMCYWTQCDSLQSPGLAISSTYPLLSNIPHTY